MNYKAPISIINVKYSANQDIWNICGIKKDKISISISLHLLNYFMCLKRLIPLHKKCAKQKVNITLARFEILIKFNGK